MNSIDKLETKMSNKLDEQVKILQKNINDANKKIEDKIDNVETGLTEQSDAMSQLQKQCDSQLETITKLESRLEMSERKQRSHNMLIEGIKETNNENLRLIVDEMLEDLETTFNVEWIDSIYRLGTKRPGADRRPIMLTFPFVSYKHEIYRNVYKLKNIQKWKGVYLQDDMSAPEQAKKKEVRAIYAYAKAQGLDVRMRGNNLVVDGVKYGSDEVLPHNLSIEKAKTVKVKDGLAFQSTHSPHSNLHKCNFKYEGREHTSSEQALQYKHAQVCKQTHVADKILNTHDPHVCMRLGNNLGENETWTNDCVTHLRPIIKAKYDQNPHLKAKLVAEKGHFYEATRHPVFGAGYTLAQSSQICKESVTAGNKLGEELDRLRDFYIRPNTQNGGTE